MGDGSVHLGHGMVLSGIQGNVSDVVAGLPAAIHTNGTSDRVRPGRACWGRAKEIQPGL